MNQIVKHDPNKAALVAGGDVAAIIPRSIEEMFRVANAISASGMAPTSLNSPEKVLVAIMAGAELGMPPFQSLQSFAIVNGRPTIYGDGLIAVVRSNGFKCREWLEGEGDEMVARCEVTRPDNGEVIERSFSVADAKVANLWKKAGPWTTNPKRMLQMRARAFACRDGAADVLRGFQMREEVEDFVQVREVNQPQSTGLRARLAGAQPEREGFSAVRAAEDAEAIEAEVEEADPNIDPPADDGLPVREEGAEAQEQLSDEIGQLGLKTGAELLAEQAAQEGSGGPTPDDGPQTAAETDLPATADGAGGDDGFPGDRPSEVDSYGGETASEAAEDPMEWLARAKDSVDRVSTLADLKALNEQWKAEGHFDRLRAASLADWQDLTGRMKARDAELKKAEARRG